MPHQPTPPDSALAVMSLVAVEFELGRPLLVETVTQGNSPAYRLYSERGLFFVKSGLLTAGDWVQIYCNVEPVLNARGIRQARMVMTPQRTLISTQGYCVF
jgi:hypothetical protein